MSNDLETLDGLASPERFDTVESSAQARQVLIELASQTQSAELLAIEGLVGNIEYSSDAGISALEQAITRLEDINIDELARSTPGLESGELSQKIEMVSTHLLRERALHQMEITLVENARQVVQKPSPGIGVSPEAAIAKARQNLLDAVSAHAEGLPSPRDPTPDITHTQPHPADRVEEFAKLGDRDQVVFRQGATFEYQLGAAGKILELATANLRAVPDGQTVPDTVLSVLGNQPAFVQEHLGFMGAELADMDTALRMPFTEFAKKIGLELSDELTAKLAPPTPNEPPLAG